MARRIKTIITETARDDEGELALDGWLLALQRRPDIVSVRVFKRKDGDWGSLPRDADILPPFDVDPHCIFRRWGDGEYRFVAVRRDGKFAGSRVESVLGYDEGEVAGRQKSSPNCGSAHFLEQMREIIETEKLMLELDRLKQYRPRRP